MEESVWELSKENIQPLKQGRQPSILTTALRCSNVNVPRRPYEDQQKNVDGPKQSSDAVRSLILQQEKEEFETSLSVCMDSPDPLDAYYRYIRWMEQMHPSGKEKEIRELVNNCLKSLKEESWVEKYGNDLRWLYVWLKFASFSRTIGSLAIYDHMLKDGHCTALAGFYLQWAGELETAGHFDEAAKIYQLGIQHSAQPLKSLTSAYEEFQIRVAQRLAMQEKSFEPDCDDATRNVLGVLKVPKRDKKDTMTTPYTRHSELERVRCSEAVTSKSQQSYAFTIYDGGKESFSLMKQCSDKKSRGTALPSEEILCKENVVSAGVWTKGNLDQRAKPASNNSGKAAFSIYVDEKSSVTNDSCKGPSKKSSTKSSTLHSLNDVSSFACCYEKITKNGMEFSFEELRAARWRSGAKSADEKGTSTSLKSGRQALGAINDAAQSELDNDPCSGTKKANSPPGNGSFTQNIYREAMAAFSNTLRLSGGDCEAERAITSRATSSKCTEKNGGSAAAFSIYTDPTGTDDQLGLIEDAPKEEADKENIDPKRLCKNGDADGKKRRDLAGILLDSNEFVVFDENNKDHFMIVPDMDEGFAPAAPLPESMARNHTTFDFDETTVVGLHRLHPDAGRMMSTPCQNVSRIQPISLSMCKPADHVRTEIEENEPSCNVESNRHNDQKVGKFITPKSPGTGQKLSTISETSREYRSSSSSSNSVATASMGNTRRQVLSGASGLGTMPSIDEGGKRSVLTTATPYSYPEDHYKHTTWETNSHGTVDQRRGITQPYFQAEGSENSGTKRAHTVRKLLLDDGERTDDSMNMHMWLPTVLPSINPWSPEFVAYQLANVPKRLDSYPNYHTFDEVLPTVLIGRSVCLGGETFNVVSLAGEGAFAKVFKCRFEQEEGCGNEVVLKVQKPCCPLEFYICQELRHRLKCHSVLSMVDHGLAVFSEAYMFTNGSVLVTDYCPYGTLLDLVNVYKQISNERSLPEIIVAYITADLLRILETVHGQRIIHGDVKPDNCLVIGAPEMNPTDGQVRTIRLIDWGRSIDMTLLPPSTTFTGHSGTSGFVCCEMQDGRPWTYQTDYFGMLGTIHLLAFGEYMKAYKVEKAKTWRINRTFKRRWDDKIWKEFFDTFLNVPDCASQPSLSEWRLRFEEFVNDQRTTRPKSWEAEVVKMRDVLAELKRAKGSQRK